MAVLALAQATHAGTINIVPAAAGPSSVTLSNNGSHAAVITTSISPNGATALNRFDTFNVGVGTSANLIVPAGANNLVSLVRDQVVIGGTVSSTLGSDTGKVGGNLIFVTPNGLVLNAGAVINTGRLVIRGNYGGLNVIGSTADDNTLGAALGGGASGAVELDGAVNAPGGIDVHASSVSVASTATLRTGAAGVGAIPNLDTAWLVSTTGVPIGTTIVRREGGIQIVADGDLAVSGADGNGTGAVLDARPVGYDGVAAAVPAGIELDSGGTLTANGALTAWSGVSADPAGDVTLSASQTVTVGSDQLSQFISNFEAGLTSATKVQIGGVVTGGEVSVTSSTSVNTGNGSVGAGVFANLLGGKINELISKATQAAIGADLSLAAYVSLADAASTVNVSKGAVVTAKGNLTIASDASALASGNQNTSISGPGLGLVVGYSQLDSSASLSVDGTLTAGKALSVSALNASDSTIIAKVTAQNSGVGMAVAFNDIGVHASLGVGADAVLKGQSVTLDATTTNAPATANNDLGYVTKAYTIATDTGAGGGVAAVTTEDITTGLTVAGSVTSTGGDVTIAALTDTLLNSTSASASAGNGAFASAKALLAGANESSILADLIGDGLAGVSNNLKKDGTSPAPDLPSTRAAAGVTVALNTEAATTSVTGSITSSGAANISGVTKDEIVRDNASASASAKQATNGATTTIAGAVSWSDFNYTSSAVVGGSVTANALTVWANTDRPLGDYYDLSLPESDGTDDLTSWFKDVVGPKISKSLGLEAGFFGSSAGASVSNDAAAKPAVGASVAYMQVGAATTAWIDQGTKLTLGPTLDVKAETDFANLSLGGPIVPASFGNGISSKGSSIGGAVAYADLDPTTVAGIDSGVVMTRATGVAATAADVAATTDVMMVTIAPLAGSGGDVGLSGTFAVNTIEGETHATISKDANLDLGAGVLTLAAGLNLNVWAVGGSADLVKADGTGSTETAASVGVAGALNLVDHDTRALIGDASSDDPTADTTPATAPVGGVTAGGVSATALATGGVNALSVAGVATDTTPAPAPPKDGQTPPLDTSPSLLSQATTSLLGDASNTFTQSLQKFLTAYNQKKQFEKNSRQIQQEIAKADALSNGTPVANGFGLAGSAAVNFSTLSTEVDVSAARLVRSAAASAPADVTIKSAEGVDMLAVTGGAALAFGAKLSGSDNQISGAFGLSDTTNTTTAQVSNTAIEGFDDVSVEGASNGSRIGAGLSLSADATGTTNGAVIAASVSMLIANDGAGATVTGGDITGPSGGAGNVAVLAYDGLLMGAGAGGLSFSSSNSVGAAATVVQVNSPKAADAELNGVAISNYADLSVQGLDGARIAGVSAAAAIKDGTSSGNAAAASLSYNDVTLGTTATVNVGTTGAGDLAISGALSIQSGDLTPGANTSGDGRSADTAGSGFFTDYNFNTAGLDAGTPVDAADLTVGTQILSLAIPLAGTSGTGSGGGVAVSYNAVNDDRAASLTGGGSSKVKVGSLSVRSADEATILSLATGAGVSAAGTALVGSLSYNAISGTSSATVTGASVTSPLDLTVGTAGLDPGATPNLVIGVTGAGHIYSLAGALGFSDGSAGALALSYNDITRTSAATDTPTAQDAGLHADLDDVTLAGDPAASVKAANTGRIVGFGVAGVFTDGEGAGLAGSSSVNTLSPVVVAEATDLNYDNTTKGALAIQAADSSTIQSLTASLAVSASKSGAPGVAINTILGSEVYAGLDEAGASGQSEDVKVGDLLVQAQESASTTAFGVGLSASGQYSLAGSLALNTTDATAQAVVSLDDATIDATGSIGVLATRDSTIDVAAGVVALGGKSAGGASIVVDDVGGGAAATVRGIDGSTIAVGGAGAGITGVRTGDLTSSLPQLDGLKPSDFDSEVEGQQLSGAIKSATETVHGLEIDASSTHISRTVAITGAGADQAGVAATVVVENISGNTQASLTGAAVTVGDFGGTPTPSSLAADVRASTQADSITLAGAIAGASVAAAAPVVSDGFGATTSATVTGGSLRSTGGVTVQATANQAATALAVSAGLSASGSLAVAAVTPRFESTTTASVTDVTGLTALAAGGVSIGADTDATAFAIFGALADSGGSSVAADVVVATNADTTTATYTGLTDSTTHLGSTAVIAPAFTVNATGDYSAHVVGASLASGGEGVGVTGNGVGIVDQGTIGAVASDLKYDNAAGAVSVTAEGVSQFQAQVGSLAIGDASASLGAIVVLSQNKIDATLTDPSITAKNVTVDGYGATGVDIFDLGVAIGGYAGIAANVVYIGVGQVEDTGALFASNGSGNSDSAVAASTGSSSGGGSNANFTSLATGGQTPTAAAAPASIADSVGTTAATSDSADSRAAFGTVQTAAAQTPSADNAASSRVRAQILATTAPTSAPSVSASDLLTVESNANLASKSANYGGAGALGGAGAATVAITRNAANSIARIGTGVDASGGALTLQALTGQDTTLLASSFQSPDHAAEADVIQGAVGGSAIGIVYADVKLATASVAEDDGSISFRTATVDAEDNTDAVTSVVGVALGVDALNIAVAKADKTSTVGALLAGNDTQAKATGAGETALTVEASGLGETSAKSIAASGGLVFAGNAAVALATDSRTVTAQIADGVSIQSAQLDLTADVMPQVSASSFGIAVAGSVAAGASVATATANQTVLAQVGLGVVLDCGLFCTGLDSPASFAIDASILAPGSGYSVDANASGSAGGVLAGISATVVQANNTATVGADVGVNILGGAATIPTVLGPVSLSVAAASAVSQYAEADGAAASVGLAVGAQAANADSSATVETTLGNVADSTGRMLDFTSGLYMPALSVKALSNGSNDAKATGGAGAIGAAVASLAATSTSDTVTTTVSPAATYPLTAGAVTIGATSNSDYRADSDATEASVVGGSGSTSSNTLNTSAVVDVGGVVSAGTPTGGNSTIEATSFTIKATDMLGTPSSQDGGSASGAGGGVINGAAALVNDNVTQRAQVNIADGVTLRQYGDYSQNVLDTLIDAEIDTDRSQSTALSIGGLMESPFGESNSTYTANIGVGVGRNVLLRGDDGIGIGTVTTQSLRDVAASQVYGLAGIGGASTDTQTTVNDTVSVGDGATIEAMGDVHVGAGISADGNTTNGVAASAQTDVFNWTVLPISVDHGATADVTIANAVNLGDAVIRSARDVTISALGGNATAGAVGTGHNPYLGVLGLTDTGGDSSSNSNGALTLDGTQITAGFLAQRAITLADDGAGGWTAATTDYDGHVTTSGSTDGTATLKTGGSPAGSSSDALGQYAIVTVNANANTEISSQISTLKSQITTAGLTVPVDPNLDTDPTVQAADQATLNAAAATSSLIAQLSQAYSTRAALAANPPATTLGIEVNGVFAAGGLVNIDAQAIAGGSRRASVTANSSPKIAITNNSSYDLVLGNLFIPSKPSGAVSYGGAAGATQLAAVADIKQAGSGDTPQGLISFTAGQLIGGPRTDVLEDPAADIQNVGGAFSGTAYNGNFIQFGQIQVGSYNVSVPNGLFTVSDPTGTFGMGVPINLFYGALGWSEYTNQAGTGPTLAPTDAALLVESYIAENAFGVGDTAAATDPNSPNYLPTLANQAFPSIPARGGLFGLTPTSPSTALQYLFLANNFYLNQNGARNQLPTGNNYAGGSVLFASCQTISCEVESNDNQLNDFNTPGTQAPGDYASYAFFSPTHWSAGAVYTSNGYQVPDPVTAGDGNPGYSTPYTYFENPVQALSLNAAVLNGSYPRVGSGAANSGGSISAVQVQINAKYVDISGTITAGPNKSQTLTIASDVTAQNAAGGKPLENLKDSFGNALATGDIGAHYVSDASGGYLQVDDVAAGAGGEIDITGKILNTNPLGGGELKVLDGYAAIDIENDSNLPLHLGTLNAGANVSGVIKLVDLGANGSVETSIYRDTPGQAVTLQHAITVGGVTTIDPVTSFATPDGQSDFSPITYTPRGTVYYTYNDSRDIVRTADYSGGSDVAGVGTVTTEGLASTPWQWSANGGQAPQTGAFVDISSNSSDAQTLSGAIGSATPPSFIQLVSGSVKNAYTAPLDKNNNGSDTYLNGNPYYRVVPTDIDVSIETAVKATYPIALVFDPGASSTTLPGRLPGGITVNSDGPVVLGGPVIFGAGKVAISADGAISQTSKGLIQSFDLSLTAYDGDIGSKTASVVASVNGTAQNGNFLSGDQLFVNADAGSVYLNLSSNTTVGGALQPVGIDRIVALNNVTITSSAGLLGYDRSGVDVPAVNEYADIVAHDVTLNVTGSVGGFGSSSNPLLAPAMSILLSTTPGVPDGTITISATGNVAIEGVNFAKPSDLPYFLTDGYIQDVRLGAINATGDVLVRSFGSIVSASDATTVDQAKLQTFLASAGNLQLTPQDQAAKTAQITARILDQAYTAYDIAARSLVGAIPGATAASRAADAAAAESRIALLNQLVAEGVTINADWSVTLPTSAAQPTSALYGLALNTLHTLNNTIANASSETITSPEASDIQRGIQAYVNGLRSPITALLGAGATPTTVLSLDTLGALQTRVPDTAKDAASGLAYGYTPAATADYTGAIQTLTTIFGTPPAARSGITAGAIAPTYLAAAETGQTWNQSELDFAVPSTAFVPVADTQFVTRSPVITGRGVTLIAADSIGGFGAPQTFTFTSNGLSPSVGETAPTQQEIQLAQAYLESAGPGDFNTAITYASPSSSVVQSISFTTRLDQPLQLNANGVVNAAAATNPVTLGSSAVGAAATTVAGDIFLDDSNALQLGTIVSQKGRGAVGRTDCNTNGAPGTAACDSEVRLQGNSIIGVATGADALVSNGATLSSPNGRALVMGGLIRLEASQGNLEDADGGPILIDGRALEVVRAAGDIDLARRSAATIPLADPDNGGGFSFGNDLTVGDVYAGGAFTMDNPFGSLFVEQLPSPIAADNRNSRLVVGTLVLRAAGDIGATGNDATTGLPNQFDITAPLIEDFIAGADYSPVPPGSYDYALAKVGVGPAPAGLAPGDGYLAIRGDTVIGGPGSVLGARDNLTIGSVPDYSDPNRTVGGGGGTSLTGGSVPTYASSIDIESSLKIGGQLFLTTDGALIFGPNADITGLGSVNANGALDLSKLSLHFKSAFSLSSVRSIILGSISAAGGTIDSTGGSVTVDGTLAGTGGQSSPFTLEGKTGVTTNGVGGSGAVDLFSAAGDVTVNGSSSATDLDASGLDVYIHGTLTGRSATLTATGPTGVVTIDGPTTLKRVAGSPLPADLTITAPTVTIGNTLDVQDVITLNAGTTGPNGFVHNGAITTGRGARFLDAMTVSFEAASMSFDASTVFSNIGTLDLTLDPARGPSGILTIPTFSGGQVDATAPTEIDAGTLVLTGGASLATPGTINLRGRVSVRGTFRAASSKAFNALANAPITGTGPSADVLITANGVNFGPGDTITNAATNIVSSGPVTMQSVLADSAWNQAVSIKATGPIHVVALSGSQLTVNSGPGGIALGGRATTPGAFTAIASQSITTTGLYAGSATLTSMGGAVSLNGVTRITGERAASVLTVKAGTAIALGGSTSAAGGMTLSAPSISSAQAGYITDLDSPGALVTLRANTMAVNFTPSTAAPIQIDARGFGGGIANASVFNFTGRSIDFVDLWSADSSILGQGVVDVGSLDMTGWLYVSLSGNSVELYAAGPGRIAQRAVKTGVLQQASIVVTPVAGRVPRITVNGAVK